MTDSMTSGEDFLAHYGVLGMKWGVRKDRRASSYSSDYARKRRLESRVKKKSINSLSNKELKDLTTRIELEKKYKNLSPNAVKSGWRILTVAVAAGTTLTTAYNIVNGPLGKKIKEVIEKQASKKLGA